MATATAGKRRDLIFVSGGQSRAEEKNKSLGGVFPPRLCFLALADLLAANRPACAKHAGTIQPLRGPLLAGRLLWYSAKLKNILGDFGNRPGFRSSLHEHIGFHDLATDWPQ
jgi:hypothetical protein